MPGNGSTIKTTDAPISRRNKVNGANQLIHAYTIKNGKFSWLNVEAKEMKNSGGQGKTVVCMDHPVWATRWKFCLVLYLFINGSGNNIMQQGPPNSPTSLPSEENCPTLVTGEIWTNLNISYLRIVSYFSTVTNRSHQDHIPMLSKLVSRLTEYAYDNSMSKIKFRYGSLCSLKRYVG